MKRKSIYKIAINLWKRRFEHVCDSKVSAFWRKRDLRGFIRQMGIHTAEWIVYDLASEIAHREFGNRGWSIEFSNFFDQNLERFKAEAVEVISSQNQEEILEAVEEAMEAEIDAMYS